MDLKFLTKKKTSKFLNFLYFLKELNRNEQHYIFFIVVVEEVEVNAVNELKLIKHYTRKKSAMTASD